MQSQETQTDDQELFHYRAENIRLQKQLKQLQDNLSLYAANNNNTSSKFMLPSEFKVKWEGMIKETMPSAFISLFEFPILSIYAIQGLAIQILKRVKELLEQKTSEFANLLGTNIECLHQNTLLLKIFQDHYQTLIKQELNQKEKLCELLEDCVKKYYTDNDDAIECKNTWIDEIDDNEDLTQWIQTFWQLCCFIQLSEQNIQFVLSEIKIEFIEFKKNEFYCVDGFGKEGANSLVIIPPVLRQDAIYNGLKHAILILSPQDQNLEQELLNKEQKKLQEITNISIIEDECRIKIAQQEKEEDNYLQKILRQNNQIKGKIINQRISKAKQDELRQNIKTTKYKRLSSVEQREQSAIKRNIQWHVDKVVAAKNRESYELKSNTKRHQNLEDKMNQLLQQFCQSSRQRSRAFSNENCQNRTFKSIYENYSSDEDDTSTLLKSSMSRNSKQCQVVIRREFYNILQKRISDIPKIKGNIQFLNKFQNILK